ncbi:hypothetical protein OAK38_07505 [Verrucomicrobia bacterium]|nr:hypothetical protein [Verrucomicrobiota bacterium]
MYTRPVSIPFLGTVRLAVLGFFLFAFSAWAQKSPAPAGDPLPPIGDSLPTIGDPVAPGVDPVPKAGDPLPTIGDPVPTIGDPLPKVADPIPTIGDPIPTIGGPVSSPAPQTGDFKFAEGEDPIIFPEPDDKGQDLDPGKNDPLTPPVPDKDDPSVDSPGVAVDPRPESGEGSKESDEKGLVSEKNRDDEAAGKDKESTEGKKDVFVAIVRTLEVNAEKDGAYLFGGKILADGGSTILGAGIELSLKLTFKNSFKIPFELKAGKSNYRVKTRKLDSGSTCYYRAYVRNAVGVNVGSVKKLKVPESAGKRGWWSEGENLGADWRRSKWFGTFRKQEGLDWVYHEKLGWVYAVSDQREGLWLWQEENGWTWTQGGVWPCIWRHKSGSWLCLMANMGGRPIFYDYTAGQLRNLPKKKVSKTDASSDKFVQRDGKPRESGKTTGDLMKTAVSGREMERESEDASILNPSAKTSVRQDPSKSVAGETAKGEELDLFDSAKGLVNEAKQSESRLVTDPAKRELEQSRANADLLWDESSESATLNRNRSDEPRVSDPEPTTRNLR